MKNVERKIKTRVRERGQLTLPSEIRELLRIEVGDDLQFRTDADGRVFVERVNVVPADQAWFWTERWQKMERQVQDDFEAGRISRYRDIDEALKDLEVPENGGD